MDKSIIRAGRLRETQGCAGPQWVPLWRHMGIQGRRGEGRTLWQVWCGLLEFGEAKRQKIMRLKGMTWTLTSSKASVRSHGTGLFRKDIQFSAFRHLEQFNLASLTPNGAGNNGWNHIMECNKHNSIVSSSSSCSNRSSSKFFVQFVQQDLKYSSECFTSKNK